MDFVQVMGVAFAIIVTYFVGYSRGLSAERPTLQLPQRPTVDERPPEHRPLPDTGTSPTTEAVESQPFPIQIGQRFVYLGVLMVCTRHISRTEVIAAKGSAHDARAVLIAEYACQQGKVNVATFSERDWPALLLELGRV